MRFVCLGFDRRDRVSRRSIGGSPSGRGSLAAIVAMVLVLALATTPIPLAQGATEAQPVDGLSSGVVADGAIVALVNAETGRFLDGDRNGKVDQSTTPKLDDQWLLSEVRPDVFTLRNVDRDRLLDADRRGRRYPVNLSKKHGPDTEWQVIPFSDGTYELINVEYGLALDADGKNARFDVNLTQNRGERDARWYIGLLNPDQQSLDGVTALVSSAATGRYLDGDLNTVDQSVFPRRDDLWVIEAVGENFTFRAVQNDRLLHGDIDDVDLLGAGGPATQWRLQQRLDGSYEALNVEAGLWLDADFANRDFAVNLTANGDDLDAGWNILVLDTDLGCVSEAFASVDDVLLCVDAGDSFVHLDALQEIADVNGGTRASGTPGFDASADYVATVMAAAGLVIERQPFEFTDFRPVGAELVIAGVPQADFAIAGFSPSGQVTDGIPVGIDVQLGLGNMSTSGCEPEDFLTADLSGPADIAVLQRGACDFTDKVFNAQLAGAEAVVLFNQGDVEGNFGVVGAAIRPESLAVISIPVLDATYDLGVELLASSTVTVSAQTVVQRLQTENVIAELPGRNPNNVLIAGAHLDSVVPGPGIQDNGSGVAALLTVAATLGENETYVPENTLRFAFWGAEEFGLIGSAEYVFNPGIGLTPSDFGSIAGYLNFDMIGSPNYAFGVFDADQSTSVAQVPIPPGSLAIEKVFETYYTIQGVPYDDVDFSGRSDYAPFIAAGIPAGGLFTGAEQIKSSDQAAIWGGTAGEQFDPCYHAPCDIKTNVSFEAMEINGDAVAYAVVVLAGSTQAINGVPGVDVAGTLPGDIAVAGPEGTLVAGGGGLAQDAHHGAHHGHHHPGQQFSR